MGRRTLCCSLHGVLHAERCDFNCVCLLLLLLLLFVRGWHFCVDSILSWVVFCEVMPAVCSPYRLQRSIGTRTTPMAIRQLTNKHWLTSQPRPDCAPRAFHWRGVWTRVWLLRLRRRCQTSQLPLQTSIWRSSTSTHLARAS